MATVKLPGIGPVKPVYLVGAAGLVLGIVGYAWWHQSRGGGGGQLSPEDQAAADAAATEQDSFIPPYSAYTTSGGTDLSQLPPMTNDEWSRRVVDALSAVGFDPAYVATTLGRYLQRQPLTVADVALIGTAIAMVGPPPVGTFSIITSSAPPVPSVPLPSAPSNLHVHARDKTSIRLSWNAAANAQRYALYRNGARINIYTVTGATVGTGHGVYKVQGINSAGKYGPNSNLLTV